MTWNGMEWNEIEQKLKSNGSGICDFNPKSLNIFKNCIEFVIYLETVYLFGKRKHIAKLNNNEQN